MSETAQDLKDQSIILGFYQLTGDENKRGIASDCIGNTLNADDFCTFILKARDAGYEFVGIHEIAADVRAGEVTGKKIALNAMDGFNIPASVQTLLQENNIPCVMTVPTALIGKDDAPRGLSWTQTFESAVNRSLEDKDRVEFSFEAGGKTIEVSYENTRDSVVDARGHFKNSLPTGFDGMEYVQLACEAMGVDFAACQTDNSFYQGLSENGLRKLVQENPGISVISQGDKHTGPYTEKTAEQIAADVNPAQAKIKKITGQVPKGISLPEGKHNQAVAGTLANLDLSYAIGLGDEAVVVGSNRYNLPRVVVTDSNFAATLKRMGIESLTQ